MHNCSKITNIIFVGSDSVSTMSLLLRLTFYIIGVRRRRSGGGPGVGCARMPVGTYLYLHAVSVGDRVAVPYLV